MTNTVVVSVLSGRCRLLRSDLKFYRQLIESFNPWTKLKKERMGKVVPLSDRDFQRVWRQNVRVTARGPYKKMNDNNKHKLHRWGLWGPSWHYREWTAGTLPRPDIKIATTNFKNRRTYQLTIDNVGSDNSFVIQMGIPCTTSKIVRSFIHSFFSLLLMMMNEWGAPTVRSGPDDTIVVVCPGCRQ